ncbi:eukaryotic translation initiation factor 3subunit M [Striga asiatica]|uniref:Eukaryotic translation initiation factor 3subunit M n=1 Tax=Striga asiatica TaxID=4170 RepID=A0A5A7PN75_STRAF|nr:eukaryotic translation initiation factor 3subunit M [Striga asiatica]
MGEDQMNMVIARSVEEPAGHKEDHQTISCFMDTKVPVLGIESPVQAIVKGQESKATKSRQVSQWKRRATSDGRVLIINESYRESILTSDLIRSRELENPNQFKSLSIVGEDQMNMVIARSVEEPAGHKEDHQTFSCFMDTKVPVLGIESPVQAIVKGQERKATKSRQVSQWKRRATSDGRLLRINETYREIVRHNIVGHGVQSYARTITIAGEIDASIRREANHDRLQPISSIQSSIPNAPSRPSAQALHALQPKTKAQWHFWPNPWSIDHFKSCQQDHLVFHGVQPKNQAKGQGDMSFFMSPRHVPHYRLDQDHLNQFLSTKIGSNTSNTRRVLHFHSLGSAQAKPVSHPCRATRAAPFAPKLSPTEPRLNHFEFSAF